MLHLVTGGSGSGKSAFAEETICRYHGARQGGLIYLATMLPYGEETKQKIHRHRKLREKKGFRTIERYTGLDRAEVEEQRLEKDICGGRIQGGCSLKGRDASACILLECISNLVANEMYQPGGASENTAVEVLRGIRSLMRQCRHLVIVTNEVCSECTNTSGEMEGYKRNIGTINCALAEMADRVTEVVDGIPTTVKDSLGSPENKEASLDCISPASKKEYVNMRLIIGGAYQGKLAYAKKEYKDREWLDGERCDFEELYTCGGIFHFEGYLRRMMEAGRDPSGLASDIAANNPDIVIVCAEIGYGLVPVEAFEREYRERTGRVCTELAAYASRVDRVICGIGTVLKGV